MSWLDRAGQNGHGDGAQTVELQVAKMALFNLESGDVPAIAVRRESVKLARTTVGTIAIGESVPLISHSTETTCDAPHICY